MANHKDSITEESGTQGFVSVEQFINTGSVQEVLQSIDKTILDETYFPSGEGLDVDRCDAIIISHKDTDVVLLIVNMPNLQRKLLFEISDISCQFHPLLSSKLSKDDFYDKLCRQMLTDNIRNNFTFVKGG